MRALALPVRHGPGPVRGRGALASPATGRPADRGFTIVEMVVVLVVIGLLLAFTLPRILGSSTFAEDQKAQTTASGALDAGTQLFVEAGDRDGSGCNTAPSSPRKQMDPGPYPTTGTAPGNCPMFANPADLHDQNGDVKFVTGDKPSPDAATASVAAVNMPDGSWRLAVAVLSPQGGTGKQSVSSCWIAWREFPGNTSGTSRERYFTRTNVSAVDATNCNGNTAAAYEIDSYCANPTADGAYANQPLGLSWRRPCPDYRG